MVKDWTNNCSNSTAEIMPQIFLKHRFTAGDHLMIFGFLPLEEAKLSVSRHILCKSQQEVCT